MKITKEMKGLIIRHLDNMLDEKINAALSAIESVRQSRDSDTKSSAGDKYETGRAMMQIEFEKSQIQLAKAQDLKKELARINTQREFTKVQNGSLVITNQGVYFISIGIGKLVVNENIYYSISLASPIGQLLHDKTVGQKFKFQEKEFTIIKIL